MMWDGERSKWPKPFGHLHHAERVIMNAAQHNKAAQLRSAAPATAPSTTQPSSAMSDAAVRCEAACGEFGAELAGMLDTSCRKEPEYAIAGASVVEVLGHVT